MRFEIHVRPNASRTTVGGRYGSALVVRVIEPPEKGRATEAALRAVAESFDAPRQAVCLIRGSTSRRKLVELTGTASELAKAKDRLDDLLKRDAS